MNNILNSRGQIIKTVDKSVEDNEIYELKLSEHIFKEYNINLIKHRSKYKPYDFSYEKIYKIAYYKIRQMKNPLLRFYLIYGFYTVTGEKVNKIKAIHYKIIDISNLDEIILNYKSKIHKKANHYLIPISGLNSLSNITNLLTDNNIISENKRL